MSPQSKQVYESQDLQEGVKTKEQSLQIEFS